MSASSKEVSRIENRMKISGSARTVGDVDTELEALDSERAGLDRRKDEILHRQARMKCVKLAHRVLLALPLIGRRLKGLPNGKCIFELTCS